MPKPKARNSRNQSATATPEGGIEKSAPIKRGHYNRPKIEFFNSLGDERTLLTVVRNGRTGAAHSGRRAANVRFPHWE
jgi:hypothetical protein